MSVALQFEARKVALKQDRTGFVLTLAIHPDEIPAELMRDFVGARYACAVVRINDDESAVQYNNRVKKAGILCRSEDFWEYMEEKHGFMSKSEDDAAINLCSIIGIKSRTELNGNVNAQKAFDEIVADYERDMNGEF